MTPPSGYIANRSSCLAALACGQTSRARTCCTANGSAGSAAASTRGHSFASPTRCWRRWGWRLSPSGPGVSYEATGETARKRSVATGDEQLTAQEALIARMARDGLSNPEIGCPHVHQRAHRPVPPAQSVRQARHRVAQPAGPRPARLTVRLSPLPVQMAADFTVRGGAMELIDRDAERDTLDRFVAAIRAGESQALVVCGEAGVGKTALLDYLAANASGCRIARTTGCQSEMELAFAALHQLCAPMLGSLQRLPAPQRDAVRTAFGMSSGPAPDRFLVGLGVLSLLSEVAEEQPLVCLVDDEQWLDRASAQVLGFVARRLVAESVGMVFAARTPSSELAGLGELRVEGLQEADARALLDSALTGPLDTRVRDQILAETRGNPLALLELPRGLTPQQLAGGFGLPGAVRLSGGIEESFRRRVDVLPEQTRRLLLIAAAEPVGDPVLVWGAAARLGIGPEAAAPAVEAGLAEFGTRVRFRHPLVRSVVYGSALPQERQAGARRPWLRSPIRSWIPIDAPGIGPMPRLGPTRTSPRSWSAARAGRKRVAAWLRRRHSSSAPRC